MAKKYKLYLAYGSNLNIRQMSIRCPEAKVINKTMIEDYELLFRGGEGCAVATIEPKRGSRVPALVWAISPDDEAELDHYEGWPRLYRKETLKLRIKDRKAKAMAYIMNDGHNLGQPSDYYLETICEGYETAGFDLEALNDAVNRSTSNEPQSSPN